MVSEVQVCDSSYIIPSDNTILIKKFKGKVFRMVAVGQKKKVNVLNSFQNISYTICTMVFSTKGIRCTTIILTFQIEIIELKKS